MAVNYSQGRENLGRLYGELRQALANKGAAENLQAQRDIDNQGLFGTGIRTSDIDRLGNLALKGAEFGQGRKALKMERAKNSFDRRMDQAKSRITELRRFGDDDSINEIRAIQAGMAEERNRFENLMSDYEEKSLWDTGFGSEGPNYKDTGEMSDFARKMMKPKDRPMTVAEKVQHQRNTEPYQLDPNMGTQVGDRPSTLGGSRARSTGVQDIAPTGFLERSFYDPDAVPDWRRGKSQQAMGERSFHDPSSVPDWRYLQEYSGTREEKEAQRDFVEDFSNRYIR